MIGNIGPLEIGIVLVIALLVFGPKKLPELGRGLGKGMREFKDGVTGDSGEPTDGVTNSSPRELATPGTDENAQSAVTTRSEK